MSDPTPILTDAASLRERVRAKAVAALEASVPLSTREKTLEVKDVRVLSKHYSPEEQRRALLTGASLDEAVKGTLVLKGPDGKVLDEAKNFTLVHLPYLTERHTVIADGNEYQVANQLRRKPGVYTSRADNGELKSTFNLGKGKNFELGFAPEKGTFHLTYGTSNVPLYPILKAMGVGHEHIVSALGKGVADANATAHGKDVEKAIGKLYAKLVHPSLMNPKAAHEVKLEEVRRKLDMTTLDPHVTKITLGHAHEKVTPDALLDAAKKVLGVHAGHTPVDDTDALTFKTFHALDDFLAERIKLSARAWMPKAKFALGSKSVLREALRPAPFSDSVRKFITTSTLAAVPTGINPLELIDHSVKITSLGEGGIPSDRAIPMDARLIHNTHYGAIDPIRSPESFHAGVDVRATITAHRDDKGNLYTVARNVRTGKDDFLKAGNLADHVVAFPGQVLKGEVDAFIKGKVARVQASQVTHQLTHTSHAYSPATSILPLIHTMQGNRAIMASKMGTQALPLIEREAPFVQVQSHLPGGESFETIYGHMVCPRAPISGTVHKIEDGWVYIRPEGSKKKAAEAAPPSFPEEVMFGARHHGTGDYFTTRDQGRDYQRPVQYAPQATRHAAWSERELSTPNVHAWGQNVTPEDMERHAGHPTTILTHYNPPLATVGHDPVGGPFIRYHVPTARKDGSERVIRLSGVLFHPELGELQELKQRIETNPAAFATQLDTHLARIAPQGHPHPHGEGARSLTRHEHVKMLGLSPRHYRDDLHYTAPQTTQHEPHAPAAAPTSTGPHSLYAKALGGLAAAGTLAYGVYRATHPASEEEPVQKAAEDRPVIERKKLGPFTFNIEIKKGYSHKAEGNLKAKGSSEDYGHLPGYVGPDGDSLDFFVGNDPKGQIFAYEKQKRVGANGELDPKAPWKTTDIKFVVGLNKADADHFHDRTEAWNSATVRFANRKHFRDWDHLEDHIDQHYAEPATKTAAKDDDLIKVPFQRMFPFPSKTYLHHDLTVKVGDKVREGQRLGESNFTKNGTLALGKNLLVGYVPYYGLNSNDAVVISQGAAKKLTSEHMYREIYQLGPQIELNAARHRMYYGTKYGPKAYEALDEHGVVRKGATVHPKDLLVAGLTKTQVIGTDALLGRISKSLSRPYQEVALAWTHGTPGEVVDVVRTSGQITVLVRTREEMQVGDKLAGRHGNKGVVAKIVPDHEMLQDEKGRPLDLLMTSAGVISRVNPSQIIETALGKVVEKTGKPIIYNNDDPRNAVEYARNLLKEHGLKDKERLYDPTLKRHIEGADKKGVMVGRQFVYKLFKSTETNFAGHGVGPYDLNEQPLKTGGEDSAKGIGKMEFDALVAHDARDFLREAVTVKGTKNEAFWKAVQLGSPLPTPQTTFAFSKFKGMLEGAGLKVDKRGSKFKLLPLTDRDVVARSTGAITHGKTLVAKTLRPESGGLFDPRLTGGPQGTLYAHIDLPEAIPHPVFKEPVRRILGLSEKEFDANLGEHGGQWFHDRLKAIDVPARIKELRARMVKAAGTELNDVVKQIKYLEALQKENIKPHEAYVVSKVPVVPPVFRPILPQPNDPSMLMVADANKLYGHLLDSNHTLKTTAVESDRAKHRKQVFNAVAALYGTEDVENDELRGQSVKGFLSNIAGVGTPKGGFFQRKLMRHTQDVSGRGTVVPDPNLNMDQIGVPEDMLWQMYDKIITARLVRTGYPALDAKERVLKRDPVARNALLEEVKTRPVLVNRAPTLHRWSIMAAFAHPVKGKTLRVSPFMEKGMNMDYDGDTLQVYAPVTQEGIEDAKHMTLSNALLSDQRRSTLMAFPQHEAVLGFTHASKGAVGSGPSKKFDSAADARSAWLRGEVHLHDHVEIKGHEKKAEDVDGDLAQALSWLESTDA